MKLEAKREPKNGSDAQRKRCSQMLKTSTPMTMIVLTLTGVVDVPDEDPDGDDSEFGEVVVQYLLTLLVSS